MRTRVKYQARYARTSGRTPHVQPVLASLAVLAMIAALSIPLATAALAGDDLTDATTDSTTTDTSTVDDTVDDTTEDTTDTVDETTNDDPSPSPSELTTTVEETSEELEETVSDTTDTITGESAEDPSPSPSPTESESHEPSDDSSGDPDQGDSTAAGSDGSDQPAGTDQQDDTEGASDTASGPEGRTSSNGSEQLADYADSDPQRNFTAAGNDAATARLNRIAAIFPGGHDRDASHGDGGPAKTGHVPAYLRADPYAGSSVHAAAGPRSTVDLLRRLQALGAGPAEIVGVLAPFPVMGPASYSEDWHAPRDGGARLHKGTDIFAPRGTPVIAVADGTITRLSPSGGLGGRTVHLTADDGTYYYYAHLDAFHVRLAEGQRVTAGSLLGFVGNTGNAITTPPHLHFEIHPGGGAAVPPIPQLDQWLADARSRLADLEAQKTGPATTGGEALTPLVAPPAWTGDGANWSQGEGAGAGLAAGAPEGGQSAEPTTHAAAPTSFAGQRTVDRGAIWALVLAVFAMFGLQRLLSRSVRRREPAQVEVDGFLDEDVLDLSDFPIGNLESRRERTDGRDRVLVG